MPVVARFDLCLGHSLMQRPLQTHAYRSHAHTSTHRTHTHTHVHSLHEWLLNFFPVFLLSRECLSVVMVVTGMVTEATAVTVVPWCRGAARTRIHSWIPPPPPPLHTHTRTQLDTPLHTHIRTPSTHIACAKFSIHSVGRYFLLESGEGGVVCVAKFRIDIFDREREWRN